MSDRAEMKRPHCDVIVRTSGGEKIGFGHVRRSLTLAQALADRGASVRFLFRGDDGATAPIREAGFEAVHVSGDPAETVGHAVASGAACAVVDANDVTEEDMRQLRRELRLAVVDDLAIRRIDADIITNSAAYAHELPYARVDGCELLLGPRFALLRKGFIQPPRAPRPRAQRVLITMGGGDPQNITARLVAWTRAECPELEVVVVAGPYCSDLAGIERSGAHAILVNPPDMVAVMRSADLAVSGGGQTTYELAASGVPALAIQVGGDQKRNLEALHATGVLIHVGHASDDGLESSYRAHVAQLARDGDARSRMARLGVDLVDGRGAERVADSILDGSDRPREMRTTGESNRLRAGNGGAR